MMTIISVIHFGLITLASSCLGVDANKQVDEGEVKGSTYSSQELGWTMEVPEGWTIVTREEAEALDKRGSEAINEVVGEEVECSGLKHLISFRRDRFDLFQSSSEPFELQYEREWEETNEALKRIVYTAYQSYTENTD